MSERLTLQDLVDLLSDKLEITKKDADIFIRELISLISEQIEQNDFVRIKDFGTFKLTPIKARKSVDVNTGAGIEIPAHYRLSFTPDKVLREAVNSPFAHLPTVLLEAGVDFDSEVNLPKEQETDVNKEIDIPVLEEEVIAPKEEDSLEYIEKTDSVAIEEEIEEEKEELARLLSEDRWKEDLKFDLFNEKIVEEKEESTELPPEDRWKEELKFDLFSEEIVEAEQCEFEDGAIGEEDVQVSRNFRKILIVAFLFILALGVWYWSYNHDNVIQKKEIVAEKEQIQDSDISKKRIEQAPARYPEVHLDAPEPKIEKVEPIEKKEIEQVEKVEKIEKVEEEPIVEAKIESGDTMRRLGEKYYGKRAFWVYIYEENKSVITDPNAVPIGTKLIIPPASKYSIDPNDQLSLKRAKEKEAAILAQFGAE